MTILDAKAICKSISRHCRKEQVFAGGRQYGVDFATFNVCYPQTTRVFNQAAEVITGRKGRFLPRF